MQVWTLIYDTELGEKTHVKVFGDRLAATESLWGILLNEFDSDLMGELKQAANDDLLTAAKLVDFGYFRIESCAVNPPRYEVQHYTLSQGWLNIWRGEFEEEVFFDTKKEAKKELQDFLRERRNEDSSQYRVAVAGAE
jgi:hypothetical protein